MPVQRPGLPGTRYEDGALRWVAARPVRRIGLPMGARTAGEGAGRLPDRTGTAPRRMAARARAARLKREDDMTNLVRTTARSGTEGAEQTPLTICEPDGDPHGGLVLFQEGFGVTDHIEDVGRRFAAEGYLVVIPHLFHRTGDPRLPYDDLEAVKPHMGALTADGLLADIDAALVYLD